MFLTQNSRETTQVVVSKSEVELMFNYAQEQILGRLSREISHFGAQLCESLPLKPEILFFNIKHQNKLKKTWTLSKNL